MYVPNVPWTAQELQGIVVYPGTPMGPAPKGSGGKGASREPMGSPGCKGVGGSSASRDSPSPVTKQKLDDELDRYNAGRARDSTAMEVDAAGSAAASAAARPVATKAAPRKKIKDPAPTGATCKVEIDDSSPDKEPK